MPPARSRCPSRRPSPTRGSRCPRRSSSGRPTLGRSSASPSSARSSSCGGRSRRSLPAREFPPSVGGWRDGLVVDAVRDWVVIAIDAARRRITVIPAFDGWEAVLNASFAPGTQVTGKVVKAEVFGVFVWLGPGRVGMVPRVWSGSGDGPGFESRFVAGTEIPVEVVDVAEGGSASAFRSSASIAKPPRPREPPRSVRASRPRATPGAREAAVARAPAVARTPPPPGRGPASGARVRSGSGSGATSARPCGRR